MPESSPAEVQTLIAAAFDRRGWEYEPSLGLVISAELERTGRIDPAKLAQRVSADFLYRAGTDRESVQAAIEAAVGERTLGPSQASTVLQFADNRSYEVNLGRGAQINNANLNIGDGQQINIHSSTPTPQLLAAVEALVLAGLEGEWNEDAAAELADVVNGRDDITLDDIRELTVRTVEAQAPTHGRVKGFLNDVASKTMTGVFSAGLISGLGEVLSRLIS